VVLLGAGEEPKKFTVRPGAQPGKQQGQTAQKLSEKAAADDYTDPNNHEQKEGEQKGEQHMSQPQGQSQPGLPQLDPGIASPMIGHMVEVISDIVPGLVKDADGGVQMDLVAVPPGPPVEGGVRAVGSLEKRAVGLIGRALE